MTVSPNTDGLEANPYLPLDTLTGCSYFDSYVLKSTADNILLTPTLCETPKLYDCQMTAN